MCSTTQFCFLNLRTYLIYLCCYLLIMVAAGSRVVNGLKCYCNPKECDVIRSLDCPGKGLMIWDPCKCCRICAKTLGETCGGPGEFSGRCEPPLQCVTKLPISSGLGVCMNLPFSSSSFTYHNKNCTNDETIFIDAGCEITNKRCQCWPTLRICRSEDVESISGSTRDTRWHFKTLEECQLNLQNLIQIEMEFDEDYTISPSTFTYKKLRRKRRSLRKRTMIITH
ncbi:cysteine-rich motor neuron 1 protein [Teleopsis dalmanni]|uniref:cysteine-rich motor neuron 1 protein n=1 Tax=Teleopsis dalmanni TaxID=139649 RepID=UPI0018CDC4E4|nr:cysteine-rich motor neuron 1 protein [Teleopsis dalmanni]